MHTAGPPSRGRRPRPAALLAVALLTLLAAHVPTSAGAQGQDGNELGREVFDAHCAMCHGPDAEGMGMHPSLRGVVDRLSREGVEVTIRQGRDVRPPMPAFEAELDDEEIDAVVAYLATLEGDDAPGSARPMMDDGMMQRWPWGGGGALIAVAAIAVVLIAVLAGVVGYLLGRARSR